MAAFLKIVSAIYLIVVWLVFAAAISAEVPIQAIAYTALFKPALFTVFVLISIPAVALYAFGQLVRDVRAMRDHLGAMRAYYELSR